MAKKRKDWKNRQGIVYSSDPGFQYEEIGNEVQETLPPNKQNLRIQLDRKNRNGKEVTLITGFIGSYEDLLSLSKTLKTKCGTGGSASEGEIIVQGDNRQKVFQILSTLEYKARII